MLTKKKILLCVLSLTILFSATLFGSEKETPPVKEMRETLTQTHKKEIPSFLTAEVRPYAKLPLLIILVPLIGAGFTLIAAKNEKIQKVILFLATLFTLFLLFSLFKPVVQGIIVNGKQYRGVFHSLPYFPFFNLTFKVDPAGLLIALISGLIWFVGTLFSFSSFKQEKHFLRYQFFSLTTYAATLGVLLAGDLLTLYIFFEGMVFLPYALFAHRGTKRALRGANIALYIGIISGLCLLAGIFLLYTFTGNLEIKPMAEKINAAMPGLFKYILAGLMIIGFGGKAGIFFEHLWLPATYPESPEPTAALSSGAMIKAGAYGIFRTVNMLFIPENMDLVNQWLTLSNIGYITIWIGVITMFFAVLSALISSNSKRMLAYHSVSQMGFIVMGIGCAAYLGTEGAMGLAGALYHMVNHSLFKAGLFLTVGAVYLKTDELDMYKLGGLWRNMPLVAIGMLIAVCGISGIPGFNGFASKCLLHHAIVEAYQHSVHFSKTYTPDFGLKIAEIIFIITCAGTFASNTKLFILTFLRKRPEKYANVSSAPWSMQISILILSAIIIFIGLFPNWLLETIIGPALAYFNFNPGSHSYHLLYNIHPEGAIHSTIEILYHPISKTFISSPQVMHNLLSVSSAILVGGIMYILGFRFGWFHLTVPRYLQVEYYYLKIFNGFKNFCQRSFLIFAKFVDKIISIMIIGIWNPKIITWGYLAKKELEYETTAGELIPTPGTVFKICRGLSKLDFGYEITAHNAISGAGKEFAAWRTLSNLDKKYEHAAERVLPAAKEEWEILPEKEKRVTGEEIAPWFVRLCRNLSNLQHTGDLSRYIISIVLILTVSLAVLVGTLYVHSFETVIIIFSVIILFTIVFLFLTKPRKKSPKQQR